MGVGGVGLLDTFVWYDEFGILTRAALEWLVWYDEDIEITCFQTISRCHSSMIFK